jgi:hypothetical protein
LIAGSAIYASWPQASSSPVRNSTRFLISRYIFKSLANIEEKFIINLVFAVGLQYVEYCNTAYSDVGVEKTIDIADNPRM